jgi:hypothetical protein
VGNTDNEVLIPNASGTGIVAPIWREFMTNYLSGRDNVPFVQPPSVVVREVCADTGTEPSGGCATIQEVFAVDQPPLGVNAGILQQVPIDLWTGLVANQHCAESVYEAPFGELLVNGADDVLDRERQLATNWLQNTQAGRNWAAARNITLPLQPPPQNECQPDTRRPVAQFSAPNNGAVVTADFIDLNGSAIAPNFAGYQLQWGAGNNPSSWQEIANWRNIQVDNGLLFRWDARDVPAGLITVRLRLFGQDNPFTPNEDRVVVEQWHQLNMVAPTAVPSATPTDTPVPSATPLPTNTPVPSATPLPTNTPAPTTTPIVIVTVTPAPTAYP